LTGCVGGVLGLANVLGQACCDLEQLYKEGKMEEAKLLQQRLIGPNMSVSIYVSDFRSYRLPHTWYVFLCITCIKCQ
jgi:hypothetical protein